MKIPVGVVKVAPVIRKSIDVDLYYRWFSMETVDFVVEGNITIFVEQKLFDDDLWGDVSILRFFANVEVVGSQ